MIDLITFKTGQLAKEKGFNEPTITCWVNQNDIWNEQYPSNYAFGYLFYNEQKNKIARPTQSELHKWLREKHKILIVINITITDKYYFELYNLKEKRNAEIETIELYSNLYEKALEVALIEALKQINNEH